MRSPMATDLRHTTGNGAVAGTVRDVPLEPARRRVRLPEVAVGVIVVIAFALAAVLWQLNATQKEPVLAVAHDVARGEVVDAADLKVVYVAADDSIAHVARGDSATVVGRVAVSDLEAGELLTPRAVSDRAGPTQGEGVVGLALEPGQIPIFRLRPGDLVNVVAVAAAGSTAEDGDELLAARAEVFAVAELRTTGRTFVSLKTTEADANAIAAAAEHGAVRLVMVGA